MTTRATFPRRNGPVRLLVVLTTLGLILPALPGPGSSRARGQSGPASRPVASRVLAMLGALVTSRTPLDPRSRSIPARPASPTSEVPVEEGAPVSEGDHESSETESPAEEAETSLWANPEARPSNKPRRRGPILPFDPAVAGTAVVPSTDHTRSSSLDTTAPRPRDLPTQLCRFTC